MWGLQRAKDWLGTNATWEQLGYNFFWSPGGMGERVQTRTCSTAADSVVKKKFSGC